MAKISPLAFIDPEAKIGENCEIGPFCFIDKNVTVGDNNVLMNSVTLLSGTRLGDGNTLFPGAVIGAVPQDLKFKGDFGSGVIMGNSTKLAGEVIVDDNAIISAVVLVHQFCRIGGYVMVQGGTRTSKDIPPFITAGREPVAFAGLNIIGLRRRGFSREVIDNISHAYRLIYQSELTVNAAIAAIREEVPMSKEIEYIIDFVGNSQRGIVR